MRQKNFRREPRFANAGRRQQIGTLPDGRADIQKRCNLSCRAFFLQLFSLVM